MFRGRGRRQHPEQYRERFTSFLERRRKARINEDEQGYHDIEFRLKEIPMTDERSQIMAIESMFAKDILEWQSLTFEQQNPGLNPDRYPDELKLKLKKKVPNNPANVLVLDKKAFQNIEDITLEPVSVKEEPTVADVVEDEPKNAEEGEEEELSEVETDEDNNDYMNDYFDAGDRMDDSDGLGDDDFD